MCVSDFWIIHKNTYNIYSQNNGVESWLCSIGTYIYIYIFVCTSSNFRIWRTLGQFLVKQEMCHLLTLPNCQSLASPRALLGNTFIQCVRRYRFHLFWFDLDRTSVVLELFTQFARVQLLDISIEVAALSPSFRDSDFLQSGFTDDYRTFDSSLHAVARISLWLVLLSLLIVFDIHNFNFTR